MTTQETTQKTYTAMATASNFHNWVLRFEITPEALYELYDGDEDQWLAACQSGDWEPSACEDEGDGGRIEIDGPGVCLEDEPDQATMAEYYQSAHYQAWEAGEYE